MFLRFEENPNIGFVDDRVFKEQSESRVVTHVLRTRNEKELWCPVTGLNEKGEKVPAMACRVQDSGEGTCYLVYGGLWGVRLEDPVTHATWDEPFLLLPATGNDLRFIAS